MDAPQVCQSHTSHDTLLDTDDMPSLQTATPVPAEVRLASCDLLSLTCKQTVRAKRTSRESMQHDGNTDQDERVLDSDARKQRKVKHRAHSIPTVCIQHGNSDGVIGLAGCSNKRIVIHRSGQYCRKYSCVHCRCSWIQIPRSLCLNDHEAQPQLCMTYKPYPAKKKEILEGPPSESVDEARPSSPNNTAAQEGCEHDFVKHRVATENQDFLQALSTFKYEYVVMSSQQKAIFMSEKYDDNFALLSSKFQQMYESGALSLQDGFQFHLFQASINNPLLKKWYDLCCDLLPALRKDRLLYHTICTKPKGNISLILTRNDTVISGSTFTFDRSSDGIVCCHVELQATNQSHAGKGYASCVIDCLKQLLMHVHTPHMPIYLFTQSDDQTFAVRFWERQGLTQGDAANQYLIDLIKTKCAIGYTNVVPMLLELVSARRN